MKQKKKGKRTCPVCGKALPKTARNDAIYCGKVCANREYNSRRTYNNRTPCIYQPEAVWCNRKIHDCSTCGWNPEVEEHRRKETKGEGI